MSSWAFQPLTTAAQLSSTAINGKIRYWDGTEWIIGNLNKFDGSEFKTLQDIQLWDGDQWVTVAFDANNI
jgi:hypothetical protein